MSNLKKITQVHYPALEIDSSENDIVQLWMNGKDDGNVIQIEREKIQELIDALLNLRR